MKKIIVTLGIALGIAVIAVTAAGAATNFKFARETAKLVYHVGDPVNAEFTVTNTATTPQTFSIEAFVYGFCPETSSSVTLPLAGFPQDVTLNPNQATKLYAQTAAPNPLQECGQVSNNTFTIFSYVHAADGTVQANSSTNLTVLPLVTP